MPTFNATNPVSVGLSTKKDHFDRAFDNILVVRDGGIAIPSQTAHDFIPAASASQLTRVAAVAGKVPHFKADGSGWEMVSVAGPQSFRGLHLRTHQDGDAAANKVALVGLEEVVMDDGVRYSGLTFPLEADITASGAAGLDTGSRTASTWYSIYLIGKASTQLASDLRLLLHREKDWTLDQSQTTQDTYAQLRSSTATTKLAQGFQPGTTGLCEMIDILGYRTGTPSGNIWLTIEADAAGVPSGTPLATSDKLVVTDMSSGLGNIRFPFRTPVSLTAGTQYWIVMQGDYTVHASNNFVWSAKGGASSYAGGSYATYNPTTWTLTATHDFAFKTYVTRNSAALTLPSGWTQSCKVGYVYNTGSNVLRKFVQHERWNQPIESVTVGAIASAYQSVNHVAAFVPPVPCLLSTFINCDTFGSQAMIAGAPEGSYLNPSARLAGVGGFTARVANENFVASCLVDWQGVYPSCYPSGTATFYLDAFEWLR